MTVIKRLTRRELAQRVLEDVDLCNKLAAAVVDSIVIDEAKKERMHVYGDVYVALRDALEAEVTGPRP